MRVGSADAGPLHSFKYTGSSIVHTRVYTSSRGLRKKIKGGEGGGNQGFNPTFSSRYATNLSATLSWLQSTLPFSVVPSVIARL